MDPTVLNSFGPWGVLAGIALTIAAQRAATPGTLLNKLFPNKLFPKVNPFVPAVPATPADPIVPLVPATPAVPSPAPAPAAPAPVKLKDVLLAGIVAVAQARYPWLSQEEALSRFLGDAAKLAVSEHAAAVKFDESTVKKAEADAHF